MEKGADGLGAQVFTATNSCGLQSVALAVSPEATSIRIMLSPSQCRDGRTGELCFDHVFLWETQGQGRNLVANGSGETTALSIWGRPEHTATHLSLSCLFDGPSYDGDSVRRCSLYALLTFAEFWADFGESTLLLDAVWYGILALFCLALVVGLGLHCADALTPWTRRRELPTTREYQTVFLLTVGLCLILLQMFLPMIGRHWQPQGRYLYPAIVPIATLLSLGWRRLYGRWGGSLSLIAWATLVFALHVLCVFGYITSRYCR